MTFRRGFILIGVLVYLAVVASVAFADGFLLNSYRFGTSGGGGGSVPTMVFTEGDSPSSSASGTYTFTNKDISTADASRYVCVGVMARQPAANRQVNSVTIGGSAATLITRNSSSDQLVTGIFCRTVTSGTTATIVVTFSGAMDVVRIAIYALYNLNSTTQLSAGTSAATSGATAAQHSFDYTQDGFIIAFGQSATGLGLESTWSGSGTITEDYETTPASANTFSAWSVPVTADGTAGLLSTIVSSSGSANKRTSYAHFR